MSAYFTRSGEQVGLTASDFTPETCPICGRFRTLYSEREGSAAVCGECYVDRNLLTSGNGGFISEAPLKILRRD